MLWLPYRMLMVFDPLTSSLSASILYDTWVIFQNLRQISKSPRLQWSVNVIEGWRVRRLFQKRTNHKGRVTWYLFITGIRTVQSTPLERRTLSRTKTRCPKTVKERWTVFNAPIPKPKRAIYPSWIAKTFEVLKVLPVVLVRHFTAIFTLDSQTSRTPPNFRDKDSRTSDAEEPQPITKRTKLSRYLHPGRRQSRNSGKLPGPAKKPTLQNDCLSTSTEVAVSETAGSETTRTSAKVFAHLDLAAIIVLDAINTFCKRLMQIRENSIAQPPPIELQDAPSVPATDLTNSVISSDEQRHNAFPPEEEFRKTEDEGRAESRQPTSAKSQKSYPPNEKDLEDAMLADFTELRPQSFNLTHHEKTTGTATVLETRTSFMADYGDFMEELFRNPWSSDNRNVQKADGGLRSM